MKPPKDVELEVHDKQGDQMESHEVLEIVYEIQGASEPNQPDSTLKERMEEIYEMACRVMRQTGFHPDDFLDD